LGTAARQVVFVVHHARSGVTALNVVSAALDADARTRETPVVFARTRDEVARAVTEARARGDLPVVGWSFYSRDFPFAREDVTWVRARAPGALHVAGGVHATAEPEATLRAGFDLVVVGEGERTVCDLFDALRRDADPRALRGVAHLEGERLFSHGLGERGPLDDYPAFNARYGKWNAIEITRGCVYACSFCQTPYMFKARFRHRTIRNVCAQIDAMVSVGGARFVRFITPSALSYGAVEAPDLGRVEGLLRAVREVVGPAGKVYFGTFPSEVRPDHVTPDALAIIKRYADNTALAIGGQSGSNRVLQAMRRGHDVGAIVSAVRVCVEGGVRPDVDFLLGVPGETKADREASIRLAERLVGMGARIRTHAFMALSGTPLRDRLPEVIEPDVELAMKHLESRAAMHGQHRRQVGIAEDLVCRRRASHGG
jgi:B12-binding domain/radical SAM domain protein